MLSVSLEQLCSFSAETDSSSSCSADAIFRLPSASRHFSGVKSLYFRGRVLLSDLRLGEPPSGGYLVAMRSLK